MLHQQMYHENKSFGENDGNRKSKLELRFPPCFLRYDVSEKSVFQQRGNIKATKILIKDNKQQYS